jgi:fructose-specific component phosphotransferase system IIB-like protein
MIKRLFFFALPFFFTLVASAEKSPVISFNRDVQPILSENCFTCHGADSAARKAGLRLDRSADATNTLDSGVVAIVPGHSEKSELVRRINLTDDDQMPPEKINKHLTLQQKELLAKWIAAGAKYEPHWSFIPPKKAPLPAVKNSRWVKDPVDNFILARLEQEKLKPNSEADKRTLIRRVTFDLTGLPPTPEEVENFVADQSSNAYEKVVDRLLASPRWGEHRGRYWLDVARYGDTHGIHFDNFREMWTYREWVINAFNQNMPFDEFTIENLAGDLLPNATRNQKIGSGFNRCNATSNEGGMIEAEYLVFYARDRVETTAQTWLGLTAGCAVCHDHKYDPFTQKDFYSLTAFFNNTTQKAGDGNIKDTPPVMVIPKPMDDPRWAALPAEMAAADKKISDRKNSARPDFENWLAKPDFALLDKKIPVEKLLFHAPLAGGLTNTLAVAATNASSTIFLATNAAAVSGVTAENALVIAPTNAPEFADVGDFERTNAFSYSAWVRLPADESGGALFARMTDMDSQFRGWDLWVEGGKPVVDILSSWPDNAIKVIGKKELPKEKWVHVAMTYAGNSKAGGVKIYVDGEAQAVEVEKNSLTNSIRTTTPFVIGRRASGAGVAGAALQDLRIYGRVLSPAEIRSLMDIPRLEFFAAKPVAKRGTNELEEFTPVWLATSDEVYQKLLAEKSALHLESDGIRKRGTVAYIMQDKATPAEAHILFRGEYDQLRDRVTPATPAFLPAMTSDMPTNRLGFAEWLLRPENPLTARVTVNRFWQELFGTGLVKTSGDFGVAGEVPSHPELLDWLAVDFREHGWDVKRIFKTLVLSATYRQSAVCSPEKIERDPQNRLLARGPRFRMDAEMVRDCALAASGLLVEKIGGPSTRPYQPDNIWNTVGLPEGDTRNYVQDHGDNLYRRSVYTFWKRQSPPASMEIFNAPSREICTVRRERTDTPLQALVTLNDPQFVEAARVLAQKSLEQNNDALDFMAERLLARPLTTREKQIVQATEKKLKAHYVAAPKEAEKLLAVGEMKPDPKIEPPLLATYTMVANELMNLDEVLNK